MCVTYLKQAKTHKERKEHGDHCTYVYWCSTLTSKARDLLGTAILSFYRFKALYSRVPHPDSLITCVTALLTPLSCVEKQIALVSSHSKLLILFLLPIEQTIKRSQRRVCLTTRKAKNLP